jgi:uncharacterized protein (TIGR02996 family)
MADLETLQDQIRANPDDWDSWLVYADWLTDEGDSRGQMIVLEHQLAGGALPPQERSKARQRLDALKARHQPERLRRWACPAGTALIWRHGFVVGVRFPRGPGWAEALAHLAAHPAGPMLSTLALSNHAMGTEGLAVLLKSPVLPRLARLNLWGNQLDAQAAALLARQAELGSLLSLNLWNNRLGDEGAAALAEATSLGALVDLDLGDNQISRNGAISLAHATGLRSLRALRLRRNRLGDEGALALARASLAALTELDVGDTGLPREAAGRLQAAAPESRKVYVD